MSVPGDESWVNGLSVFSREWQSNSAKKCSAENNRGFADCSQAGEEERQKSLAARFERDPSNAKARDNLGVVLMSTR